MSYKEACRDVESGLVWFVCNGCGVGLVGVAGLFPGAVCAIDDAQGDGFVCVSV
jgi:hypothetical protein